MPKPSKQAENTERRETKNKSTHPSVDSRQNPIFIGETHFYAPPVESEVGHLPRGHPALASGVSISELRWPVKGHGKQEAWEIHEIDFFVS